MILVIIFIVFKNKRLPLAQCLPVVVLYVLALVTAYSSAVYFLFPFYSIQPGETHYNGPVPIVWEDEAYLLSLKSASIHRAPKAWSGLMYLMTRLSSFACTAVAQQSIDLDTVPLPLPLFAKSASGGADRRVFSPSLDAGARLAGNPSQQLHE